MHHPTDRITHTIAFVTPVVEHWLEREIAQWVHPMKDRSDDPSHHERTLLPRSYISPPLYRNHFRKLLFSLLCSQIATKHQKVIYNSKSTGELHSGYNPISVRAILSLNTLTLDSSALWLAGLGIFLGQQSKTISDPG